MSGWLFAAAVGVGVADALLIAVSWRRRAVLGGLCGAIAVGPLIFVIAEAFTAGADARPLVGALAALVVGAVLVVLGDATWRLLEDMPDEDTEA